ncbi:MULTISPECIES: MBL fold metallo-hydrolase [Pseudomonas]|uniref:MBL fold metallo-hydrolase n=1 Tax=Pseudomonas TaxID=286 RepID=UPI002F26A764
MNASEEAPQQADLIYPFEGVPAKAELFQVAASVYWIRMPLPFALNHINLWALEDGDGWTIVDTGLHWQAAVDTWTQLLENWPDCRPVLRLIVTHMHIDHVGMAGWLAERLGCQLWMARQEYLHARLTQFESETDEVSPTYLQFYKRAGWSHERIEDFAAGMRRYGQQTYPLPGSYRRLIDGETFAIGRHQWRVLLTSGHSPEHASLYCPGLKLYIAGDQVLPRISSNVSTHAYEPQANPLADWYAALARIAHEVPDDVLVLPSHNECFRGLHSRLAALRAEVMQGLANLLQALERPMRVIDIFEVLFGRGMEQFGTAQCRMATGEAVSHLNLLLQRNEIHCQLDSQGIAWYQRTPQ